MVPGLVLEFLSSSPASRLDCCLERDHSLLPVQAERRQVGGLESGLCLELRSVGLSGTHSGQGGDKRSLCGTLEDIWLQE